MARRVFIHIFWAVLLTFSFWLMWHTFSYDSAHHTMQISGKVWSDFGNSIPLIRSFSLGQNWPPQYPLYPGEPSRYHFLFYLTVGMLEKIGFRIDIALNLLSGLGFFLLLVLIWKLSLSLFSSRRISALSVLFFLFNGSLSWLDFLKTHSPSPQIFFQLVSNSRFPSFGPWNGSLITAFWNLNIYTNQRHLGISFAAVLLIVYLLYTDNRRFTYTIGFLVGSLVLLNQAAFVIAMLFVGWFFLFRPRLRLPLLISGVGFLPWVYLSLLSTRISPQVVPYLGFLSPQPATWLSVVRFWWFNLGLHFILIPLGFVLSPRKSKVIIFPLLILFILPNLFRFSPDIINNHKFFNLFLIIASMYSAYTVYWISQRSYLGKIISVVLITFTILGGVVDIFPVINDVWFKVADLPANPDAQFFASQTQPRSVVLNSTWFYNPASLAGRYIYNGYSYFTWSYGYDQTARENSAVSIYRAVSASQACELLIRNNISYVELNDHPDDFIHPNFSLWRMSFVPIYRNNTTGITVYDVAKICP
jgi:hypothetical protein